MRAQCCKPLSIIEGRLNYFDIRDTDRVQDFVDQANKNGVVLLDHGMCQFCGGDYQRGIYDCMELYSNGLQLLDFNNPQHRISRFLSVDAHALQHPEIHGRWSNHFHLTRMHLIIDRKQHWDYNYSPRLSNYLNIYKQGSSNEYLVIPEPLDRGRITAKDLTTATTADECVEIIGKWADEVYHSWSTNHSLVSRIANGYLGSVSAEKYQGRGTTNH